MSKTFTRLFGALTLWCIALPMFAQQDYRVRFSNRTELFADNFKEEASKTSLTASEQVNGLCYRYLQFAQIPSKTARAEMEQLGVHFYGYVHFGAYLVGLPANIDLNKLASYQPRSLQKVSIDWKIARTLRELPYGDWAKVGEQILVNLQVYPNLRIADGAKLCRMYGMDVVQEGNQNGFITVRLYPDDLEAIAAQPFVRYLELIPPPGKPEDTGGRSIHRSNLVDSDSPIGRKYNGAGVAVLTRDDGAVGPHIDFQGRLTNLSNVVGPTHGDGVSGIMAGAGNLDPTEKGMASGSDLYVVDYVNSFQDQTLPLHLDDGVKVTNSSYSDGCNVGYTMATQTVDQQLHENPTLMHVFSAGNMGESDCGYGAGNVWGNITGGHKMAKNAIATANLYADGELEVSSSRGPAYDGRLKPDIAAHGQNQGSTTENNAYQVFGGTSGAAPGIAGCLAQLHQAFRTINNGEDAPGALLKSALMVTANDMGNIGPDYKYGWGHVNAYRAVRLLEDKRWIKGEVDNGGTAAFAVDIPEGVKQARLMVYWAEPEAQEAAAVALINDLDCSVTDASGNKYLPWLLDPTPIPSVLNTPATHGRDSLNNMEQVAIDNPAAGAYIFTVKGFEVPLGPQAFYFVWEFLTDEVKITYPAGGEGFVPTEKERIHWDAQGTTENFTLRYSTDDGNSWQTLTTLDGTQRMYEWTVPNTITGKAHLMLLRGNQADTTDYPFSIARVPNNITVLKACPDSLTLGWNNGIASMEYDVYLLGQKVMEIAGHADTNFLQIPITDPGLEKWFSVRSNRPEDGLTGRRAIAVNWAGGLLNCPQPFDGSIGALESPAANAIVKCEPTTESIRIRINNEGQNTISGATVSYQVDNNPPVTEPLPDIAVGESLSYTFLTPVTLDAAGTLTLKVWPTVPGDNVPFNDTIVKVFPVVTQPATNYFQQTFTSTTFPPSGWLIGNPDGALSWERSAVAVQANGNNGQAVRLNCFSYNARGEEDYLNLIPVDLSNIANPGLGFDVAHAAYASGGYSERLRVEVFTNCDPMSTPIVVYDKADPQLATTTSSLEQFVPDNQADWRTELIDLNQFAGQQIIIRIVGVNDYGNNIYLDNIRLLEYNIAMPLADFNIAQPTICRGESVSISDLSTGNFLSYKWTFGAQATPASANTDGPHSVSYLTPGDKQIKLIVTNSLGADTLVKILKVLGNPVANFLTATNGNIVTCNNTTTNGTGATWLWNFGDGNTSTEQSPVHTYANLGNFTISLTATNPCSTTVKTKTVDITTVGVGDLTTAQSIQINPNPNTGNFAVEINAVANETMQIELLDAAGRLLRTTEVRVKQGNNRILYDNLNLAKGIYQLKVRSTVGVQTFSVAVVKE